MKRLFVLTLILTAALIFGLTENEGERSASVFDAKLATAQTSAPPAPAAGSAIQPFNPYPLDNKERLMGVWRNGKAVFSDIKLLDMFVAPHYSRGYRPEQPIKFSHQLHVEKNQMECQYCHSGVNKADYPTIPSVESCMGCHKLVKTDSPEIQKLKKYYDEGKPVEWVPVHNLPEHAHFPHERHIKAGVGCQSCHGQVQKMQSAEKVSSLKMGWCLSCHREKGATIDCAACHY